jgi:GTP-binding protein
MIGRSNVGKSSLINMLTNRKELAKTSQTPGKTQLINHFIIDDTWFLADLPGYGYAKTSKVKRKEFSKLISDYILNRENLYCLFILIDIRHKPQKIDLEFIRYTGKKQIPISIVFTKADKISSNARKKSLEFYLNELLKEWEELPKYFVTSSVRKTGQEELIEYIEGIVNQGK